MALCYKEFYWELLSVMLLTSFKLLLLREGYHFKSHSAGEAVDLEFFLTLEEKDGKPRARKMSHRPWTDCSNGARPHQVHVHLAEWLQSRDTALVVISEIPSHPLTEAGCCPQAYEL